jgi:hypothetical protein
MQFQIIKNLNSEIMEDRMELSNWKVLSEILLYKTKDGHLAREKGWCNRIKNDPAFQRTRENGSEFGRAGKAGKTLRTALRTLLLNSSDGRVVSRLHNRW